MRPEPVLLQARGIGKRSGAQQALADVHVDVREGEILALARENSPGSQRRRNRPDALVTYLAITQRSFVTWDASSILQQQAVPPTL